MKNVNSYKYLSHIYNSTHSEFWDNYWGLIKKHLNLNHKLDVLDLGCGTGNAIPYLMPYLSSYRGIDFSREMLNIAQKLYPNLQFDCSLITNFKVTNQYNLVISAYDTINHLLSKNDWEDVILQASKSLKVDGIFIFDVNTPYDHKFNWPNYHNVIDTADLFMFQRGEYSNNGNAKLYSTFFCKEGKQSWVKYEDSVEHISFNSSEIRKMLSKASLKLVAEIDIHTGKKPKPSSEVIIYICSKS
jgi:SAM-dependent methyltransferase